MRKLIAESEERVETRMMAKMNQKVQAVHKRFDAFELNVLERPAPTTDISSFRTELASLRADVDAILATPAASCTLCRHRSSHKTELTEKEKASKRQRRQGKKEQKASILDAQPRQQRAREMVDVASSSMHLSEVLPTMAIDVSTIGGAVRVSDRTTDVVVLVEAGTTEADPNVDLAGSRKLDPSAC
uniref:Integrase core domain containing protein n=1 Tax=Solanum tuberosum TaxID=4113 RepID=M1D9I1_SOLTU